jgi:hypothetical protein
MTGIFNQNIKAKFVKNFIDDVANTSSNYYITFGKFFEWPDDNIPPSTNSSITGTHYSVNKEILFGKKVSITDIAYVTKKKTWTANTVYDYYDDTDQALYSKNYYVVTSLNRVYKCLFNNYGVPSTDEPTLTVSGGDFDTADGYKWKYLYTINGAQSNKFTTNDFIPIIPSPVVSQFAENGALHVIEVTKNGNNYTTANGYIDNVISNTFFKIANTNSSTLSGAYTDSTFYIYSGGGAGSLSPINNYIVNTTGKFVSTTNPIIGVDSTSLYRIDPQVKIVGDGTGAAAVADVDANTGKITSVTVVSRGLNYTYANVTITNNTYFGSDATARAIISPKDGHGSDAVYELGCNTLGISISTNVGDNFPDWVNYRQIALINNPVAVSNLSTFSAATFNQMLNFGILSYAGGLFDPGEIVQGFTSKATATVAHMDSSKLYVLEDVGTFQPFETLTSLTTGKTCIITTINNKDLVPYSSTVYYYKNIQPISRTGVKSEDVKLYFNF